MGHQKPGKEGEQKEDAEKEAPKDDRKAQERTLCALMACKHKQTQVVKQGQPGDGPMDGAMNYQGEIEYTVENDMVHVNATQTKMQYTELFSTQINKFADLLGRVKSLKL